MSRSIHPLVRPTRRAFTLLELTVAIIVLGILAALVIPNFNNYISQSKLNVNAASLAALGHDALAEAYLNGRQVPNASDLAVATSEMPPLLAAGVTPGLFAAGTPLTLVASSNASPAGSTSFGTVSYDIADSTTSVGLSMQGSSGGCAMALIQAGKVSTWTYATPLGTNCAGNVALGGSSQSTPSYASPTTTTTLAAAGLLAYYSSVPINTGLIASDGTNVYNADTSTGVFSAFSITSTTNTTKATPDGSGNTDYTAMAIAGGFAWIADYNGSHLYEVNLSTGAITRTITLPSTPSFIYNGRGDTVATDGTYVWVAGTSALYEYSASSGALLNTITQCAAAGGIALDGSHAWVANYSAGTVSEINPSTGTIAATVTVGTHPFALADDGTHVWVANVGSSSLTEINASTAAVVTTVALGAIPVYVAASDGANVWVLTSTSSLIQVSATTGTITQTFPLSTFTSASGLSYVTTDASNVWLEGSDSNGDGMLYKMRP